MFLGCAQEEKYKFFMSNEQALVFCHWPIILLAVLCQSLPAPVLTAVSVLSRNISFPVASKLSHIWITHPKILCSCTEQVYYEDTSSISPWDAICLSARIPPHRTAFDMQLLPCHLNYWSSTKALAVFCCMWKLGLHVVCKWEKQWI